MSDRWNRRAAKIDKHSSCTTILLPDAWIMLFHDATCHAGMGTSFPILLVDRRVTITALNLPKSDLALLLPPRADSIPHPHRFQATPSTTDSWKVYKFSYSPRLAHSSPSTPSFVGVAAEAFSYLTLAIATAIKASGAFPLCNKTSSLHEMAISVLAATVGIQYIALDQTMLVMPSSVHLSEPADFVWIVPCSISPSALSPRPDWDTKEVEETNFSPLAEAGAALLLSPGNLDLDKEQE